MKRSDFAFDLPQNLIAQEPRERGRSRMLVVRPGGTPRFEHRSFGDFPSFVRSGDVLVLNDTEVIPARLIAKPKGSMTRPIELLLTKRIAPWTWECWAKPARRLHVGDRIDFGEGLLATVRSKVEGTLELRFFLESIDEGDAASSESSFWEAVNRIGIPPLPPYIERPVPRESDREAYQTVYARERGAVAAPTAGLHFTPEILEAIDAKGVQIVKVTLHVGIGTFKPVKVENLSEHRMDEEEYIISSEAAAALNQARSEGRRIVAVGTTSVRTLESAASAGEFKPGSGRTSLFITPAYSFRAVDALLTNFHLPESTLLMLVSAFAGVETIREAYREAIAHNYFFYSFGDCMFIESRA